MTRISVENLKAGMILSEDAVHATGRVLLKANSELSDKHIKIFRAWGVLSLNIKSEDDEPKKTKNRHSSEEIEQTIKNQRIKFQHCDLNHSFMSKLFHASIKASLEQKDQKS